MDLIRFDEYASSGFDDLHSTVDQYQIYDLVGNSWDKITIQNIYKPGENIATTARFVVGFATVTREYALQHQFLEGYWDGWGVRRNQNSYVSNGSSVYASINILATADSSTSPVSYDVANPDLSLASVVLTLPEQVLNGNNDHLLLLPWLIYGDATYNVNYSSSIQTNNSASAENHGIVALQAYDPLSKPASGLVHELIKNAPWLPPDRDDFTYSDGNTGDRKFASVPSWKHLISGYPLDARKPPQTLTLRGSTSDGWATLSYYQLNPLESHPLVSESLDWRTRKIKVEAGAVVDIKIAGIMMGTLHLDFNGTIKTGVGEYEANHLLQGQAQQLLDAWAFLESAGTVETGLKPYPLGDTVTATTTKNNITGAYTTDYFDLLYRSKLIKVRSGNPKAWALLANNDRWLTGRDYPDPAPEAVPTEVKISIRQLDKDTLFYQDQPNNSIGSLTMDSPRLLEIHAALQADYYGAPINGQLPAVNYRVMIEKVANILGFRPNRVTGKHDREAEKKRVRQIFDGSESNAGYGGNYFDEEGTVVRRVPNQFDKTGQIKHGGYVGIPDLPHLIKEVLDQISIAIGGQESGAIEIREGDQVRRYPNQLELLKDVALVASATHKLAHQNYLGGVVTQQQTGEIIAGLGLPTVLKNTTVATNGQIKPLPYWGVAPNYSLGKKIDNVLYNTGIVLGQMV